MQRSGGLAGGHQRSVGLVLTGGTIGSHHGPVLSVSDDSLESLTVGGAGAEEIDLLTGAWEGTGSLDVQVRSPIRLLSENLKPEDWIPIAQAARDLAQIDEVSGVVIFHGTDTMAYTAAALSFLLADLDKPVVLTGSNLPPDQPGSDAARNAHDALIALDSLSSGTYIVFAGADELPGLVHLGTRVRKVQASGQAYDSVNGPPIARIEGRQFLSMTEAPAPQPARMEVSCAVDPRVLTLRLYPGLNFEAAFSAVVHGAIHGVVIELYASATGPDTGDEYSLAGFIQRCVDHDLPVVTTVNIAPDEPVNVYETTLAISEAGGLFLDGMLPETATVKLMWALAQRDDTASVLELMRTPIAGELAPR